MNRTLSRRELAVIACESAGQMLQRGDYQGAKAKFTEALALHPGFADAHFGLAKSERYLANFPAAEAAARAALQADPRHGGAAHYLGAMLVEMDRLSEALPFLQAAVEWDPTVSQHYRDLGVTQLFLGDIENGRVNLLKTIELDVHSHEVLYTLVRLQQMNDGSPDAARVLDIARSLAEHDASLPPAERAQVLFSLGKAYEDRGEIEDATELYRRANAARRSQGDYDIAKTEQRYRRIAEVFNKPMIDRLQGLGVRDARPIFIVGMPRSGSTLVEQILAAHPEVHGAGEIFILPPIVEGSTGKDGSHYPEWGVTLNAVDCQAFGKAYLERVPTGLPGKTRTTDKWLENMEYLGLISAALPDAVILNCRRDPRDLLFSCWTMLFSNGQDYSYDIEELTRYWKAHEALMRHWRDVLPPGRMLEVPYEDVVADTETWARRILGFCGLEWDDQVMRFWESRRPVKSASMVQVRQPIYDRSIGRWKPFETALASLFEAAGPAPSASRRRAAST
ncbi:MAG: tetratricopeptide repeat-containing sulfotransferase family protein [Caulobacterales bacterium]